MDINNAIDSAMGWAQDANAFVCSTVVPDGWDSYSNEELYPDYCNSVIDTIDLQVAKAGYRLAKWRDLIAGQAGSSKMIKREVVVKSEEELNGQNLLPPARELTAAQRRRAAVAEDGCGCDQHKH